MDDKRKTTLIQKDSLKGTDRQTHNVLTYDVENINSTNTGRDLLLANKPRNRKDPEAQGNYFT